MLVYCNCYECAQEPWEEWKPVSSKLAQSHSNQQLACMRNVANPKWYSLPHFRALVQRAKDEEEEEEQREREMEQQQHAKALRGRDGEAAYNQAQKTQHEHGYDNDEEDGELDDSPGVESVQEALHRLGLPPGLACEAATILGNQDDEWCTVRGIQLDMNSGARFFAKGVSEELADAGLGRQQIGAVVALLKESRDLLDELRQRLGGDALAQAHKVTDAALQAGRDTIASFSPPRLNSAVKTVAGAAGVDVTHMSPVSRREATDILKGKLSGILSRKRKWRDEGRDEPFYQRPAYQRPAPSQRKYRWVFVGKRGRDRGRR